MFVFPSDVDVDKPDEKSIMTYVAQFLEKYPDPDVDSSSQAKVSLQKALHLNGHVADIWVHGR